MNTTFHSCPTRNGTAYPNNGQNGAGHLCDYDEIISPDRLEPSTLAHVNSEALLRELLRRIGENPDRDGLQQTPARIIRSWNELFSGYGKQAEDVLITQFQAEQYDEIVLLRGVEFYSTCEHHLLPFSGRAHVGYLPDKKVVGLSKLARLVDVFARRLQIQERLTEQIATALEKFAQPRGVGVMLEAQHFCMLCRGTQKQESAMVTSSLKGDFIQAPVRSEFFALLRG